MARNATVSPAMLCSFPMAAALAALFFLPWLTVSCDPQSMLQASGGYPLPPEFAEAVEPKVMATATGWQIALGEVSLNEDAEVEQMQTGDDEEGPPARYWLLAAIGVPGVLAIVAFGGGIGAVPLDSAGKAGIVLGLLGLGLCFLASRISYADDMLDNAQGCPAALSQAKGQLNKIIITSPTTWLWLSMGLYGGVAVCGVAASMSGESAGGAYRYEGASRSSNATWQSAGGYGGSGYGGDPGQDIAAAGSSIFEPDQPEEDRPDQTQPLVPPPAQMPRAGGRPGGSGTSSTLMPGSPYAIAQPDQADADPAAPADAPGGAPGGLIGPGQRSAPPVADGRAGPDESPVAMPDPAPEENPAADADPGPACDPPTPARPDAATPPTDSPGEGGDGSQGPEYGKRNEQRWHHPDEDTPVSLEGLMDDE